MPIVFEMDDQEYNVRTGSNNTFEVYRMEREKEILLGGFIATSTDEEYLREQAELVIEEAR